VRLLLSTFLVVVLTWGCTRVEVPGAPAPADLPPLTVPRTAAPAGPGTLPPPTLPEPPARAGVDPLPPLTLPAETGDVRALWVVRTALVHPDSARAAVRRADAAGFNTLLVQVRGRGDAYYDSRLEPYPDPVNGSILEYDPLATVLDEAHRRGMRVHAWVNVHVVASAALPPRNPMHLVHSRPELLAVPRPLAVELFHRDPRDSGYLDALLAYTARNGESVEGLYTSPVNPWVQEHLVAVVRDLVERYPVDGVHLDYVRFPSPEFDFSRGALEAFRSWVLERGLPGAEGVEHVWARDPLAYVTAFPEAWDAFRMEQVTHTVERLYRTVKGVRPGSVVSAAVFADADDARRARYQDWEGWLHAGIIDVIAPMAYTPNGGVFDAQIARATALDPRRVWAGLGIYQDSFQGAVSKGQAALRMRVGGVALFSYDWAAGPEGTGAAGGPYLDRFVRELWGR